MAKLSLRLFLCSFLLLASSSVASAYNFSDITQWVGSGANESALVIDWHDGQGSQVWGYRWDGSATGADMFAAIAAADPNLYLYTGDVAETLAITGGDGTGGADSVYGIGYDSDGDGFTITPGAGDTGFATDPDDRYAEGWFTNYWGYFVNIDNSEFNYPPPDFIPEANPNFGELLGDPYDGGSWGFSGLGFAQHDLFDGSWDGWGHNGAAPALPIPEPASVIILASGTLAMMRRRRA